MLFETSYAHEEALVDSLWMVSHLHDPQVRLIEVDAEPSLYVQGHLPGAIQLDWYTDIQPQPNRDLLDAEQFASLCSRLGISRETTVVFYGDQSNWYATYAFWLFRLHGHTDLRLLNGGRRKWELEGRCFTQRIPHYPPTNYLRRASTKPIRAVASDIFVICTTRIRPSGKNGTENQSKTISSSYFAPSIC